MSALVWRVVWTRVLGVDIVGRWQSLVYCAGLESQRRATVRGFESYSSRQLLRVVTWLPSARGNKSASCVKAGNVERMTSSSTEKEDGMLGWSILRRTLDISPEEGSTTSSRNYYIVRHNNCQVIRPMILRGLGLSGRMRPTGVYSGMEQLVAHLAHAQEVAGS